MSDKLLQEMLLESPEGNKLINDLKRIEKPTANFLKNIIVTFPEFTGHDIDHSYRIIDSLNQIFPDKIKNICSVEILSKNGLYRRPKDLR